MVEFISVNYREHSIWCVYLLMKLLLCNVFGHFSTSKSSCGLRICSANIQCDSILHTRIYVISFIADTVESRFYSAIAICYYCYCCCWGSKCQCNNLWQWINVINFIFDHKYVTRDNCPVRPPQCHTTTTQTAAAATSNCLFGNITATRIHIFTHWLR